MAPGRASGLAATVGGVVFCVFLAACGSSYQRATMTHTIEERAWKDHKLSVTAREMGDTVWVRFVSPSLVNELLESQNLNRLLLLLSRIMVSMDHSPRFAVFEVAEAGNPRVHLLFTQHTTDLKRLWGNALNRTEFFDRQVVEYAVNNTRMVFDAKQMDMLDLMILAASAEVEDGEVETELKVEDVNLAEFLAKVAANRVRRKIREQSDKTGDFVVRSVEGSYSWTDREGGVVRLVIDILDKSPASREDQGFAAFLLPKMALEVKTLLRMYAFTDHTRIIITEKNSGRTHELTS